MLTEETARAIVCAYQEIRAAETLLKEVTEGNSLRRVPDLRDAFGRHQRGMQLSIPQSESSYTCYNVQWSLCEPVLKAHINEQRSILDALNILAREELGPEAKFEGC